MAEYTISLQATSNATASTDDQLVEIKNAAGMSTLVKRVVVSFPITVPVDQESQVRVVRNSAAGAGGSAFVPLKRRQNAPSSAATVQIKNGTASFTTGANTDTVKRVAVNTRSVFEWIARDEYDYIEAVPGTGGYIAVVAQISTASQLVNCDVDWEE